MQDIMEVLRALAEDNRVRILCALKDQELCVCQLIELLGLAPSTVSKHLSILRNVRLVESRKDGRWIYYGLSRKPRLASAGKILGLLFRSLDDAPQIVADHKQLEKILKLDTEELCRKLFRNE